jgi:exonuclease III
MQIAGRSRAPEASTLVEGQPGVARADEGEGVNTPSGVSPSLEGLTASAVSNPTEQQQESKSGMEDAGGQQVLCQEGEQGWERIRAHRHSLNALDRRSFILWGVPASADTGLLDKQFISKGVRGKYTWRGVGLYRHVLAEFESMLHKKAQQAALRAACGEVGIRAVETRNWSTRRRQRVALKAMTLDANCFTALSQPQHQLDVATLHRRRPGKKLKKKTGVKSLKRRPQQKRVAALMKRKELTADTTRGSLKLGALNSQGGISSGIAEIEEFVSAGKYDVVGLSDVKLRAKASLSVKGYKVFRQKAEHEDGKSGVLFLVADHMAAATSLVQSDVANQLWIRITGTQGRRDLFVCCAYLPQESAPKADRDEAYVELEAATSGFASKGDLVVLGDLNAKLLSAHGETEERLIGKYGEQGKRTGNGALLYGVMKRVGLVSLLGRSRPSAAVQALSGADYWWSRHDKVAGVRHTIDFVLASEGILGPGARAWVDYTHLQTDHHLVGAEVSCPRALVRRRGRKSVRRRFKMEEMIQKSSKEEDVKSAAAARENYEAALVTEFGGYTPSEVAKGSCECVGMCACAGVKEFVRRMHAACETAVGSVPVGRKFSRSWWDDEVKTAVAARRKAYAAYLPGADDQEQSEEKSAELWARFAQLRRACAKLITKKKKEDWERLMVQIEYAHKRDQKQLWQLVGRFVPSGKMATMEPMRRRDGTMARNEEEILETWGDHQESLGAPQAHSLEDTMFASRMRTQVEDLEKLSKRMPPCWFDQAFTKDEVLEGVEALSYHKASTSDGTTNPMFKCGGDTMAVQLCALFNFLRAKELMYTGWQEASVVNLFKEGDRADPGNYRGIALISCLGKLYLSLWARRLAKHGETTLEEGQGGFRSGRSTVDQALSLHEVLRRRKREGKTSFLCFIDFRKAFDTVWHDGLWKALWNSGVKGKAWRVVRSLYTSMKASVKLGDKESRKVSMHQGVRQGCPLSPTLFNYFINALAKDLRASGLGIKIEGLDAGSLLYADDVVLVAESTEALQGLIDVVDRFCRRWHMDINLKKSEVMVMGKRPACSACARMSAPAPAPMPVPHDDDDDDDNDDVDDVAPVPVLLPVPARPCVLCSPWSCRGTTLKVVSEYKYLGIWFTSDLLWTAHINKMVAKARGTTAGLGRVFSNGRIPTRVKSLVWLATARPQMEHGGEVWKANSDQAARLESVQVQAACRIFKLNRKTKTHATRALLRVPSLQTRRDVSRLKYFVKAKSMQRGRLVRELLRLDQGHAVKGQGQTQQWRPRVENMIFDDAELTAAFAKVEQSAARNQGVVPLGVDPTIVDEDIFPVRSWHRFLRRWSLRRDLKEFMAEANNPRSTLRIMRRAVNNDDDRLPAFPLTKAPNRGQNQIRLRLLSGTAALNTTLSRYTERTAKCPFGCGVAEDTNHFLLHCDATADLRRDYTSRLNDSCECARRIGSGGEIGCADFFTDLDDDGKALFMLGGPVDGREPEMLIDAAAKCYVASAYERRKARLNQDAADPLVMDLTTQVSQEVAGPFPPHSIMSFFLPVALARSTTHNSTHPAARISAGASGSRSRLGLACARLACAHSSPRARARPNRSSDKAAPSPELGLDSMTHKSREAS